ncbi:hypothetical protein vBSlqSZDD2_30 [Serratia phage vB_SlqS_ZDD2]|nr:hypothetical protein vBSlqSZDD2_30 [Serratia phage vB_SlqS_ZDD2]
MFRSKGRVQAEAFAAQVELHKQIGIGCMAIPTLTGEEIVKELNLGLAHEKACISWERLMDELFQTDAINDVRAAVSRHMTLAFINGMTQAAKIVEQSDNQISAKSLASIIAQTALAHLESTKKQNEDEEVRYLQEVADDSRREYEEEKDLEAVQAVGKLGSIKTEAPGG